MNENDFFPDPGEVRCLCDALLPIQVQEGLLLFNSGKYFEAHEVLEAAWLAEKRPIRELYRGILQVGVGFYHITRGNFEGAHKLFQRGRRWLAPFPPVCQGIQVETFRQNAIRADAALLATMPNPSLEKLQPFFFKVEFDSAAVGDIHA